MITMKDFIETIEYKITGGSSFGWHCFGYNARWLDCEDRQFQASAVFDSETQVVYLTEVHDFVNNRSYRWINPDYVDVHAEYGKANGIDVDVAYDDVNFTTLDVADDFLEKCSAIVNKNFNYDTRVTIQLDLNDSELLQLMTLAHKKDITLNQLVEQILTAAIADYKQQE